jgi:putative DNA primase/helicase
VANGLLDLTSGTLRPTTPADRIRDLSPVAWAGLDYAAPRWNSLLHGIFGGEQAMIDFAQRLFGYAISGARSEQVLPILWGSGANGKSTLVEALSSVLGPDLCMTTQTDSLMDAGRGDGNAARPYIAMLRHKRLVWASESREGGRLNVGLAKQLTGDDTMTARALYGKPISFRQTHTIMLISNHRPRLPMGGDEAIWRRLLLVPFTQCFVDEPRRPNEHRRERNVAAALQHERPGILAWLGRGALEWQRIGLRPPAAVTETTRRYREEEDLIGQYMQDRLVHGERLHVVVGDLYSDYVRWCEQTGLPAEGGREFGRAVTARLGPSVSLRSGRRVLRVYPGVSLGSG